jgi:trimeric autotransporter adhesin
MKHLSVRLAPTVALLALTTLDSELSTAHAQGTAFTYQGQLQHNGSSANGKYDFQFSLFDAMTNGSQVGVSVTSLGVGVTNGLFTTMMDFGPGVFTGQALWLQIGVETNGGGGNFTPLGVLQPLTPTPYAMYSASVPAAGIGPGTAGINISGNAYTATTAAVAGLAATATEATTASTATTATTATTANGVAAGAVTAAGIASGQVVKNLNGLTDGVTLSPGVNVTITPSGNTLTIASIGGGGTGWSLTGNRGTSPANGNFLGTLDDQPLELWVNGLRALRLEPGVSGDDAPNVIGGSSVNYVASGIEGATISGGGEYLQSNNVTASFGTVGGGTANTAGSYFSTVGGGYGNTASGADASTVGGGYGNNASGYASAVGGGSFNQAPNFGSFVGGGGYDGNSVSGNMAVGAAATVAGGLGNLASGLYAMVGGGVSNTASGPGAFVGGGGYDGASDTYLGNVASGGAAMIGGGMYNFASGNWSAVGGGEGNIAGGYNSTVGGGAVNQASAGYATIPGGYNNVAGGLYSFAAGNEANATNQGAFVWADSQNGPFYSTANDQFSIRAQGGLRLDNSTSMAFGNQPREMIQLYRDPTATYIYGIGVQTSTFYTRTGTNGGFAWYQGGVFNGNQTNAGGGKTMMTLGNTGNLTIAGTLAQNSDRNVKSDFQPVDARSVLEKIAAMPFTRWHYTNNVAAPHMGPMAQDFYAAFGLGEDDRHITTVDEGGVALAAIQGLNQKLEAEGSEKDAEIHELKQSVAELKQMVQWLSEKK